LRLKFHLFENYGIVGELAEIEYCGPKIITTDEDESNGEYSDVVGLILLCFDFR
jgi:hypothetical protein